MKVLALDDKVLALSRQSAISCLGMLQRLAYESDVGCKIIRVCEVPAAV